FKVVSNWSSALFLERPAICLMLGDDGNLSACNQRTRLTRCAERRPGGGRWHFRAHSADATLGPIALGPRNNPISPPASPSGSTDTLVVRRNQGVPGVVNGETF